MDGESGEWRVESGETYVCTRGGVVEWWMNDGR